MNQKIKAILCCPFNKKLKQNQTIENRFKESCSLIKAIDLELIMSLKIPLSQENSGTLIGKGKIEEIRLLIEENKPDVVIIDTHVSPIQQRNLEIAWKTKVLDRTGLILEIFGRRAATKEGVLQVELARLMYQKTRLVRAWSHLERQRGGGGFIGGPGETQKEMDRRIIDDKLVVLRKQLEQVVKTRTLHRSNRKKTPYPIVALVGYTNAGKSTLFNQMTNSEVLSADMLFATLDPTLRSIKLPHYGNIILSDTVGFISDLPTQLISAFKATLEEVLEANIILHVIDVSNPEWEIQKKIVENILKEIGLSSNTLIIEVWNKIDALPTEEATAWKQKSAHTSNTLAVSAVTREGLDNITESLSNCLSFTHQSYLVQINPESKQGDMLAWFHQNGLVEQKTVDDNGKINLLVKLSEKDFGIFEKTFVNFSNQVFLEKINSEAKTC